MVAKKSQESTTANLPAEIDWTTVTTWDDAFALAPAVHSTVDALGDGATLIQDKSHLLTVGEFLILDWRMVTDKKTLRDYVSVLAIRREGNQKFRFNDGSTGIMAQLEDYEKRAGKTPLLCQGVRVSEYTVDLADGTKSNASTYYLY